MKSEAGELVAELARLCASPCEDAGAGLEALRERDPCGAEAFDALANRFGWQRDAQAGWQRARTPRWTPGWVGRAQQACWLDLFESAFGYRMDEALLRWKYRHEDTLGMGAWRDGELVAFYGAMTREVLYFGQPARTVQIGDVMTRPDERGVMTRSGPFQIAAASFIERSVGYGRHFLFGFGFPTHKALQVAQKLSLYEQVDEIMELTWTPRAGRRGWRESLLACVPLATKHRAAVEALWQAMAEGLRGSVIGMRGWDYLQDRYAGHPLNHYRLLLVRQRLTGRPLGVVVLRDREDAGLEILDLVAPPRHFAALLRAARGEAQALGRARCFLWLTRSHCHLLEATGPAQAPLGLAVPANVWSRGPSADELRDRWWLTGGDMDFR